MIRYESMKVCFLNYLIMFLIRLNGLFLESGLYLWDFGSHHILQLMLLNSLTAQNCIITAFTWIEQHYIYLCLIVSQEILNVLIKGLKMISTHTYFNTSQTIKGEPELFCTWRVLKSPITPITVKVTCYMLHLYFSYTKRFTELRIL